MSSSSLLSASSSSLPPSSSFSSKLFHLDYSTHCLNDCCLIQSPYNRGGVMIIRPSLSFCISNILGDLACRTPIQIKAMSFLLFEDSPWMKASITIFFLSTSNIPSQSQLIVEKRYPSRKTFHFITMMEKPHRLSILARSNAMRIGAISLKSAKKNLLQMLFLELDHVHIYYMTSHVHFLGKIHPQPKL